MSSIHLSTVFWSLKYCIMTSSCLLRARPNRVLMRQWIWGQSYTSILTALEWEPEEMLWHQFVNHTLATSYRVPCFIAWYPIEEDFHKISQVRIRLICWSAFIGVEEVVWMVYCFQAAWVENIISRQAVRCLSLNTSYVNKIILGCQQASWQDPLWFWCHYVMTTPAEIVLVEVERCSQPPCVRHKNISQYTSHSLKTLFDQQILLNMIDFKRVISPFLLYWHRL